MNNIYFTPGPTQLYPTVPFHIKKALEEDILSIAHRSKKVCQILESGEVLLKELLNIPRDYRIYFLSSGTECMERVIQNCVEKYSFHFVNGSFSNRFFKTAQELGKRPKRLEVADGLGFMDIMFEIHRLTDLICFTHNETSTGFAVPLDYIYQTHKRYPDKLITIDIVSSAPSVYLDYSQLDCVFFSIQKGFGLPAGLAVMIVSPRAFAKAQSLADHMSIGSYHSFLSMEKYREKNQTPETPNVLGMYLFHQVLVDMKKKTIADIRRETEEKAHMLYSFFESSTNLKPFIENPLYRSNTVIVISTGDQTEPLMDYLKNHGIIVGSGYGKWKEKQIRIANFPSHTKGNVEYLLQLLHSYLPR